MSLLFACYNQYDIVDQLWLTLSPSSSLWLLNTLGLTKWAYKSELRTTNSPFVTTAQCHNNHSSMKSSTQTMTHTLVVKKIACNTSLEKVLEVTTASLPIKLMLASRSTDSGKGTLVTHPKLDKELAHFPINLLFHACMQHSSTEWTLYTMVLTVPVTLRTFPWHQTLL